MRDTYKLIDDPEKFLAKAIGRPTLLYQRFFGPGGDLRPEGRGLGEAVYDAAAEAVRTGRNAVVTPPLVGLIQEEALEAATIHFRQTRADLDAAAAMIQQFAVEVPRSSPPSPRAVPQRETGGRDAGCEIVRDSAAGGRLLASDYPRWRELTNRCNAGK